MHILYIEPLSGGWNRMKKALFQPFDLGKWFTLGFTAFLASLLDGNGGGGGANSNIGKRSHADMDDVFNFPGLAWEWLNSHPVWFTLIVMVVVLLFVFGIILTWLSSRGKFMFLDNVVHDKAEVKKPWYEFTKEGNSLFLWRLVYGLIVFIVIIASFAYAFLEFRKMYFDNVAFTEMVMPILGLILYFFVVFVITGYISLFLNDFVVPLMYKYRIPATQAWGKFLPLMSKNLGHFIVYGLFCFVLIIAIVFAVILFGFATLCIGFLLLIIPYIGAVVFLPVSFTWRAFSLEYLRQFGDEFNAFPEEVPATDELTIE